MWSQENKRGDVLEKIWRNEKWERKGEAVDVLLKRKGEAVKGEGLGENGKR